MANRNNTMNRRDGQAISPQQFTAAGLAGDDVHDWLQAEPGATTDYASDRTRFSTYWQLSARLIARLPQPARRNEREQAAVRTIHDRARAARSRFLASHGDAVY